MVDQRGRMVGMTPLTRSLPGKPETQEFLPGQTAVVPITDIPEAEVSDSDRLCPACGSIEDMFSNSLTTSSIEGRSFVKS